MIRRILGLECKPDGEPAFWWENPARYVKRWIVWRITMKRIPSPWEPCGKWVRRRARPHRWTPWGRSPADQAIGAAFPGCSVCGTAQGEHA